MPILRIDTINKEKTLPCTDNADSSASFRRDFDSYTIEFCDSAGNPLPSVNQAFTIKTEEKVSCFPCSPMYSKTGDVNGMCIQTREFAY